MSLYSVEALCAFVEALDSETSVLSLRQIVNVLEHMDNNGWEIARKPTARAVTVNDPVPAPPPDEPTKWPPSGISRLWATDMGPDRAACMKVESIWELSSAVERGASLIEARTDELARKVFLDTNGKMTGTFTVGEKNYFYYYDNEIPF